MPGRVRYPDPSLSELCACGGSGTHGAAERAIHLGALATVFGVAPRRPRIIWNGKAESNQFSRLFLLPGSWFVVGGVGRIRRPSRMRALAFRRSTPALFEILWYDRISDPPRFYLARAPSLHSTRSGIPASMQGVFPRECWAKTTEYGRAGISVRDHCLNVGCVAEGLLQYSTKTDGFRKKSR